MESTEKCEAVITHFNGKFIKTPPGVPDPLLCKFADGGQKKRQSQSKFVSNGRAWARDGDTNGWVPQGPPSPGGVGAAGRGPRNPDPPPRRFYPAPYGLAPGRMLPPAALAPYLPSPVSSYQGAVLAPAVDHAVPLQPSVVAPLAQQLGHLSLGSAGTYVPAAATVPGAFIPPYPPVPPALPLE
ncbi:RNA-binding motif, partial [Lamprotornis superbus]